MERTMQRGHATSQNSWKRWSNWVGRVAATCRSIIVGQGPTATARPRGSGACACPAELGALACAFVGTARLATLAQAKDGLRAQLCRLGMYTRRPKLHRF